MRSGRLRGRDRSSLVWVSLTLAGMMVTLNVPSRTLAQEITAGEIIIEATALRPQVLMTEPEHEVTFVNRSGRPVHLDLLIRDPELHHVIQVPDRIRAVFHRPGRHPYVVHFSDPAVADLRGAIEVVRDPYGGPDPHVCSGVTVQEACIER
jgi:hypothetical protein